MSSSPAPPPASVEPPPPPQAGPDQMKSYYENAPKPPAEPGPDATEEQRAAYEQAMEQYESDKAAYEQQHGPPPEPAPVNVAPAGGGAGGGAPGFPAARMGDLTAHGGTILAGDPNTIIGGKPAARLTDMHTCPMVTGIVPHVGGPVSTPGSSTVIISGLPAARVTDMCTCTGPPDTIAMGDFNTLIG